MLTDYDKLIDRQMERAAVSAVAGFAGDSPRELAALLIAGLPAEDDMTAVAVALAPRASRD